MIRALPDVKRTRATRSTRHTPLQRPAFLALDTDNSESRPILFISANRHGLSLKISHENRRWKEMNSLVLHRLLYSHGKSAAKCFPIQWYM
jgi:hypothetical protein